MNKKFTIIVLFLFSSYSFTIQQMRTHQMATDQKLQKCSKCGQSLDTRNPRAAIVHKIHQCPCRKK